MKYYSREWNITRGNAYYSREPNITRGDQYYSRGPYITRGNEILLAGMKYYSRKCINYSRDRTITCGNEILLAGIQYYSRKWIITRGKKYYSRERIITQGNLFISRGDDILLAGDKYWQYMAPEGFRSTVYFIDFTSNRKWSLSFKFTTATDICCINDVIFSEKSSWWKVSVRLTPSLTCRSCSVFA